jgi:hypothetical protein
MLYKQKNSGLNLSEQDMVLGDHGKRERERERERERGRERKNQDSSVLFRT